MRLRRIAAVSLIGNVLPLIVLLGGGRPPTPQSAADAVPPSNRAAPPTAPIPADGDPHADAAGAVPKRSPSVPFTPAERELVDWATARFDAIGLDLPDVRISFHDDTAPCAFQDGVYRRTGGAAEIAICVPDRDTYAFVLARRRTLIHELAHAWDHANLDDDDRAELLERFGTEGWYAPESAWDRRGVERFAETLVWGLYDQRRRPVLVDVPCRDLHADFVHITGSRALGPIEPNCRTDV